MVVTPCLAATSARLAVIAASRAPHHINPRGRENLPPVSASLAGQPCGSLFLVPHRSSGKLPPFSIDASSLLPVGRLTINMSAGAWVSSRVRVRSYCSCLTGKPVVGRLGGLPFLDRVPVPTDYLNGKAGNRPTVSPGSARARSVLLASWCYNGKEASTPKKVPCRVEAS